MGLAVEKAGRHEVQATSPPPPTPPHPSDVFTVAGPSQQLQMWKSLPGSSIVYFAVNRDVCFQGNENHLVCLLSCPSEDPLPPGPVPLCHQHFWPGRSVLTWSGFIPPGTPRSTHIPGGHGQHRSKPRPPQPASRSAIPSVHGQGPSRLPLGRFLWFSALFTKFRVFVCIYPPWGSLNPWTFYFIFNLLLKN